MTTIDVKLKLSDELLAQLERESKERQVALDDVVSDVLADYFDEPTSEELIAGLELSLKQVIAGDVRPADDVLAELKQELHGDADES